MMVSVYKDDLDNFSHVRSVTLTDNKGNKYIEEIELDAQEIRDLTLDKMSQSAPFTLQGGNFTILENYLFDFWSRIIGKDAVLTFMYLKRHSYNSDLAHVSIKDLCMFMNVGSLNTMKKYIRILEEYGFIAMFHRYKKTADNRKDEKNEVGVLFKLRQTIPMLNSEQVEGLGHKRLIDLHNDFVKKYNADMSSENQVKVLSSTTDILSDLIRDKGSSTNRTNKQIAKEIAEVGSLEFAKRLLKVDVEFDTKMKNMIKECVSKPTFEVLYSPAVFVKQGYNISVLTLEKFHATSISGDEGIIRGICAKVLPDIHSDSLSIRGYTFGELLIENSGL